MKTAEKEEVVEITMDKMEQIRKAVGDFRNTVASQVKDLHAEIKDWRFGMESHEDGVTVEVSVKLFIKPARATNLTFCHPWTLRLKSTYFQILFRILSKSLIHVSVR